MSGQSSLTARRLGGGPWDPSAGVWNSVTPVRLQLQPVPLAAQPTEYLRTAWRERSYGRVGEVDLAAAHDGQTLFIRLAWKASPNADTEFPDAAAIVVPSVDDAPAETMGSPDAPVELWYWQANGAVGVNLVAHGPGVFRPSADESPVHAKALRSNGEWEVVFARQLGRELAAGTTARFGVAVWDGTNEERAGIGAVTPRWIALRIEA